MENFKVEVDEDGIAVFTFDVPGRSMNTITAGVMKELPQIVEQIKTDPAIKGAVLQSGKATGFCAGADLGEMGSNAAQSSASAEDRLRAAFEGSHSMNRVLRSLETCGKPVACALEGLALGGGLEIALATHYRVAADNPKSQFGLPESKVGLLPGAGGTQRLPRLIGVQNAAMMILQGEPKKPAEAKALGIVHELVGPGETLRAAKKWLKGTPDAVQPWDKKGFRVKDGPYAPGGGMAFVGGNAMLMKQSYGNYPAQKHIMSCLYEGIQVPMDAALRIESRYFVKTLQTPQARAMIRSLFLSMQELSKGGNRPEGFAKYEIKKVGVLGAGFMGAGVAYVQAMAGVETVLIDTTIEAAEKGKDYAKKLLDKRVSRGQMTQEKADATLALITPSTNYDDLKGSDLVIEAVFENREIKAEVTKKAEAQLADVAVFGSNTSTLPITGLSEASVRPKNFIGVHFFSPVDKMGLVELILGKETSEETVAKAIDYVLKIKKTPIIVNDSRGFYTSRIVGTFIGEGLAMLAEGIKPAIIENIGKMAGMPVGPLSLNDEVAIDLSWKIREQTKKDLGAAYKPTAIDPIIEKMVVELQRFGRKNGKGFYDYPAQGKKKLWPGITDLVATKIAECPPDLKAELIKRTLYIQALETARCFEEGILTAARDADIGSILGWGFAPYTGGTASLIDGVGLKPFVAECEALAAKYGERFKPNALLREMAEKGETFYSRFGGEKAKMAA
ncbi:MAG: 3-hydroxyacyl-CoA dehydrogenase / enoyl-CoA hydratase / 3-hydroxybutyryl-CoA epimerase [Alphaproteobacteria bacterium]|nr:MAG: 3-hydroxyacyl-CoA dehydrogenase / enoyl-CoA hydratase / 3-hydroxybutyryl-CoA epimerase [Caulobacteraceae bacterium]TPW08542.1 MAG: 3-hydroxyacyl-CoA dehydrogenase / enoyl-CoA hydratase / 3-hydroxybutyryl-CoA epimerase [Alphaproteobacteria bacterium]